jgi:hypothetical protein
MMRPPRSRAPQAKSLAQQKADFTAEGAPPSGPAAAVEPVAAPRPPAPAPAPAPAAPPSPAGHTHKIPPPPPQE